MLGYKKEFAITKTRTQGPGHGAVYHWSEPSVIPLSYSGAPGCLVGWISKFPLKCTKYLGKLQLLVPGSVTRLGDLLDFGQLFKAFGNNYLSKSPTLLGYFCKGVKIVNFSSKIIFGHLYRHLAIFFWSHWCQAAWCTTWYGFILFSRQDKVYIMKSKSVIEVSVGPFKRHLTTINVISTSFAHLETSSVETLNAAAVVPTTWASFEDVSWNIERRC